MRDTLRRAAATGACRRSRPDGAGNGGTGRLQIEFLDGWSTEARPIAIDEVIMGNL
jgi:hypothetical protein